MHTLVTDVVYMIVCILLSLKIYRATVLDPEPHLYRVNIKK